MALIPDFDPGARRDIDRITSWLAERSPGGARNVLSDILRAVELLVTEPDIGRPFRSRAGRLWVTRRYRYIILYQVRGDRLIIRNVYHPRQNRPF